MYTYHYYITYIIRIILITIIIIVIIVVTIIIVAYSNCIRGFDSRAWGRSKYQCWSEDTITSGWA